MILGCRRKHLLTPLFFLILVLPATGLWAREGQHQEISPERVFVFEKQEVVVNDFKTEGFILDIGGGGEGIIGQLKGSQVIAIDLIKKELEDAPPGPLKIVMDARSLGFLDNTFNTATIFFTFMYIKSSDHEKVFQEVYRVVTPGGRLLIWDVIFPGEKEKGKDYVLFPLSVRLPNKTVNTGYGVRWPEQEQGLPYYLELAQKTGFKVISQNKQNAWFFLELQK